MAALFEILQEFANKLKGKQKKNAQKFMTYMKKTWQKSYPPKTWNYFMYSGATTNNHQEGYNSRLNNTKNLKANGNPYLLLKVIVQELKISENKVISAGVKNVKKSTNTKNKSSASNVYVKKCQVVADGGTLGRVASGSRSLALGCRSS